METYNCPEIIREYLLYAETIKNQSSRTINGYFIDLRTFFRFIILHRGLVPKDTELKDISISDVSLDLIKSITTMDIYEFLHFAMNSLNNSPATRSRKLSCLKTYFNYLSVKTNKLSVNPAQNIELPSTRKTLPKYLTLDESVKLLTNINSKELLRDYCIITLFLNCGMRLSELVGINVGDIREDTIRIIGKGNKERIVYLNNACLDAINTYLAERNSREYKDKDEKALFLNRNGGRLKARRVQQIVEESLKNADLSDKGYSPHKLRHTAATLMYQHGGVDMLSLKEILGHEHVTTTEIYTHISNAQLKQAVDSSPLSKIEPPKVKK